MKNRGNVMIFVIFIRRAKMFWAIAIVKSFWTILSAKTNLEWVNIVSELFFPYVG